MTVASNTPDGGQYPEATSPDQTNEERMATELADLIQSAAESKGWTSEVVQPPGGNLGQVILGLTSPSGRDFSLMLNPTP